MAGDDILDPIVVIVLPPFITTSVIIMTCHFPC